MECVIGIDPGISGAIVVLREDGSIAKAELCPTLPTGKGTKRDYDYHGMARLLRPYSRMHCAIELVGPMPKQGVTSMFNFGKGWGAWIGMAAAYEMPLTFVRPQNWQKVMLDGYPGGKATKESAVRVAKNLWAENIMLVRKKDWGIADAALIAEWLRLRRKGELQ